VRWPLVLILVGLIVPLIGGLIAVRAIDRFAAKQPEALRPPGEDLIRLVPTSLALPIGVLGGAVALFVGLVWLLWSAIGL
jgi:hypothetical protein